MDQLVFSLRQKLPADEGGVTKMAIVRLLPGCYVWFASLAVLPIAALLQKTKQCLLGFGASR